MLKGLLDPLAEMSERRLKEPEVPGGHDRSLAQRGVLGACSPVLLPGERKLSSSCRYVQREAALKGLGRMPGLTDSQSVGLGRCPSGARIEGAEFRSEMS